ncbi:MAG TPA: hypothetical protein VK446_10835 [Methylocystis sp.]|nr:hypothetical protein [Methylocystis sp.]
MLRKLLAATIVVGLASLSPALAQAPAAPADQTTGQATETTKPVKEKGRKKAGKHLHEKGGKKHVHKKAKEKTDTEAEPKAQ